MTTAATETPTPHYLEIAARALAACAEQDLWFPKPNPATTTAWARHLQHWKLELDDTLAGVAKMYDDNGSGFRPLPKDLIDAARFCRADRCQRETPAEREAREDRRDRELEANQRRLNELTRGFGKSVEPIDTPPPDDHPHARPQ